MTLTRKQQRFVDEFMIDLNAAAAARRAGYSSRTAEEQGYQLLRKTSVAAAISFAQSERALRTQINSDKVLVELAKIAFADLRKAVSWRANVTGMHEDEETGEMRLAVTHEVCLVDSDKLDDQTAAAIAEVSQTDKGALKIKLHDKLGALTQIGRHLGMFTDKSEVTGKDGGPIETRMVDAPPAETRDEWIARKQRERGVIPCS